MILRSNLRQRTYLRALQVGSGEKPFLPKSPLWSRTYCSQVYAGQYQEVWISPDKWRREFVLADFPQVEVGSSDWKWVSRNLEFNPGPSYLLTIP